MINKRLEIAKNFSVSVRFKYNFIKALITLTSLLMSIFQLTNNLCFSFFIRKSLGNASTQ